jgi:hypothetical protein
MKVGADQPPSVRALRMPRPRMPPKMKPPLIVPGKIAMPSAFAAIEVGMDVSDVAMISLRTVIDSRMRLDSSEFGPSCA